MARLYADENFPQPAVLALQNLGHEVLTALQAGQAHQAVPDEAVLQFAREQQRILLTLNRRDFIKLHAQVSDHAGIIICTFDPDFTALAERIHTVLSVPESLSGQLIRVQRPA